MDIQSFGRKLAHAVPASAPMLKAAHRSGARLRGGLNQIWPDLVRARTEKITIAITAHCNLRCTGCRYGRDFMPGSQLPYALVAGVLEDAAKANIPAVRLYGGEPLLHPELPRMIETASRLGIGAYVTSNGLVLDRKIDALHAAGLRKVTIGYYGQGDAYDRYVQRPGRHARLVESLDAVRAAYGPDRLDLQFNFLLSRQTATIEDFEHVRRFAERYDARVQIDIVHYSLPYFQDGPELDLQFRPEDEERVTRLVEHLVKVKARQPHILTESPASLASIGDWALRQEKMRIACDAGKLLWIGADGSVKLCYVAFDLGNLHDTRLSQMLYTPAHHEAARNAFQLNCPNCHCERGARVEKHGPSFRRYAEAARTLATQP
ncbi:radical SAM protein [Flavisphingomonas formosensis]|uniref:radical SAM protein n=1 Tax=Flavisphingomonas formosensis TaxID=861534 RepID=UPI0012F91407|nr:radical SAM protein [Sphingomonas formosensis]